MFNLAITLILASVFVRSRILGRLLLLAGGICGYMSTKL